MLKQYFPVWFIHFLPALPFAGLALLPFEEVSNNALSSSRASFRASACATQNTMQREISKGTHDSIPVSCTNTTRI